MGEAPRQQKEAQGSAPFKYCHFVVKCTHVTLTYWEMNLCKIGTTPDKLLGLPSDKPLNTESQCELIVGCRNFEETTRKEKKFAA